ncbi:MAG: hypothetical protein WKG07_41745 [Hymenobacter sp.]
MVERSAKRVYDCGAVHQTTGTGKLASLFIENQKRLMMVSVDIYRSCGS